MRRLIVAVALIGFATGASAADYPSDFPVLRGSSGYVPAPPTYTRWTGLYVGGQAGYGISNMNFSRLAAFNPSNPFLASLGSPSAWAIFGRDTTGAASYGAFIGYNAQWDDVILGVEFNYNHTGLSGSSSVAQAFSGVELPAGSGNLYDGTVVAASSLKITDYSTLRLRGGWAFENVLPYGMVGVAFGWGDLRRDTTASGTPTGAGAPFVITEGASSSPFLWGYAAGVGMDVLLSPTVFLRGEYEFVQFFTVSTVKANIQNVRGGLGFRF